MTPAERQRRRRSLLKQAKLTEYPMLGAIRPDGSIIGPDLVMWERGTVQTATGDRRTVYCPTERPFSAFYREALSPAELRAIIADLGAELDRRTKAGA